MQQLIMCWKSLVARSLMLAALAAGRGERMTAVAATRCSRQPIGQRRGSGLEWPDAQTSQVPYFSVV